MRRPLKEYLSSQPLKTNENGAHTHTHNSSLSCLYLKPVFAYQSQQTLSNLSAITASGEAFTFDPKPRIHTPSSSPRPPSFFPLPPSSRLLQLPILSSININNLHLRNNKSLK